MKVIYLAFANSSINPLPYLTEEYETLYELLSEKYLSGDYIIHAEPFASVEKINKVLDKYKDNLAILHFSGHAGSDIFLMNDESVFSKGIADQLKYSAEKGVLKLVVLNGCSTYGQVTMLKQNGVPAIVSTSAPVQDKSAKEFSIRFWGNLLKDMNIEDAYLDALGPAQTATSQNLSLANLRHLFTEIDDREDPNKQLWRLDGKSESSIQENPIPIRKLLNTDIKIKPNEKLIETLYDSFKKAGSPHIQKLGDTYEDEDIVAALLNNMPIPIGIHLQKLLCPTTTDNDDDTLTEFWKERLKEIGQFFQTSTEFLGIIMIAQIWELFIHFDNQFIINQSLKLKLNEYLTLKEDDRKIYNYFPLIKLISDSLKDNNIPDVRSFIEEQEVLKDLYNLGEEFTKSCDYLFNLRKQTVKNKIDESRLQVIAYEAEMHLCKFVKPLGFIHRYNLVSVQKIDILKFRHTNIKDARYKHQIIKCMQALTDDKYSYYYMRSYVDNWSVMLIKLNIEKNLDKKGNYEVTVIDSLNLSPFVIDRNSFIDKANLSYIMFFNEIHEETGSILYQWIKKPTSPEESYEINDQEEFDPIRSQFEAFREVIRI